MQLDLRYGIPRISSFTDVEMSRPCCTVNLCMANHPAWLSWDAVSMPTLLNILHQYSLADVVMMHVDGAITHPVFLILGYSQKFVAFHRHVTNTAYHLTLICNKRRVKFSQQAEAMTHDPLNN